MDHPDLRALEAGETILVEAAAGEHRVVVTDRRLTIASDHRVILDLDIDGIRRIQFDIERRRPATMVVVPELAHHEPQVLVVRPRDYDSIGQALAAVGRHFSNGLHGSADEEASA